MSVRLRTKLIAVGVFFFTADFKHWLGKKSTEYKLRIGRRAIMWGFKSYIMH